MWESLLVAVGRVLDGDVLRGWVDDVVNAAFFDMVVVDEMVRVGVVIGSTDGLGWGAALADFEVEGTAGSDFGGVSNSCGRTCEIKREHRQRQPTSWPKTIHVQQV